MAMDLDLGRSLWWPRLRKVREGELFQVLGDTRLATSRFPMFRSADTYRLWPAPAARRAVLCAIRRNFSEVPIAFRLAIRCVRR